MHHPSAPARAGQVLVIEPFYGGSHRQLIDTLIDRRVIGDATLASLPASKWKWRLRASAFHFSVVIPRRPSDDPYALLLCSSMLNLPDLLALRTDLQRIPRKVVYFHENQLEYPNQATKERDFQFGFMQLATALAADVIAWNSEFNLRSFLLGLPKLFRLMPKDQRADVAALSEQIKGKSHVVFYPVASPPSTLNQVAREGSLRIVWNHRWEWDKGPLNLFRALQNLKEAGVEFRVAVVGESFGEVPAVFEEHRAALEAQIHAWGYLPSREDYWACLRWADVCVSTAQHEFFGVSVVEAIMAGCYPLCPNELVYPEYLASEHLYNTQAQLVKKLRYFAKRPESLRARDSSELRAVAKRFTFEVLRSRYVEVLFGE